VEDRISMKKSKCVHCEELWVTFGLNIHNLCWNCFYRFDLQKMIGRFIHVWSLPGFINSTEDLQEWMNHAELFDQAIEIYLDEHGSHAMVEHMSSLGIRI